MAVFKKPPAIPAPSSPAVVSKPTPLVVKPTVKTKPGDNGNVGGNEGGSGFSAKGPRRPGWQHFGKKLRPGGI